MHVCLIAPYLLVGAVAFAADVRVSGDADAVLVQANRATVSEVLSELRREIPLRYQTSVPLDAAVDGSFSGSLQEVLSRLLVRYSYVIKKAGSTTELIVVGQPGASPEAALVVPAVAPSASKAAQWRASIKKIGKAQAGTASR